VDSTHDLSSLLYSIIYIDSETSILPRAQLLQWLKPRATTTALQTLVGLPWEIYRAQNLTPAHPHTIDLYTKGGAAVGYEGTVGIIEQYGLGFVVLTAGSQGVEAQIALQGALLKVLMPAVEEATRAEAQIYTGTYSTGNGSISSTGLDIGGSMKIEIDNRLGLRLKELTRNGSDIIEAIKTLWDSQSIKLGNRTDELRLYPTDVVKKVQVNGYGNWDGEGPA